MVLRAATENFVCDVRSSDLPECMAGNRPTTRNRWSMDVGTRLTGGGDGMGNRGVNCDSESSETEQDCGTSAYCGTYYDVTRTENENA